MTVTNGILTIEKLVDGSVSPPRYLYSLLHSVQLGIQCNITSPSAGATVTQGTPFTITGTVSVAGTVVVKEGSTTLGSATMSGLNWSYSWTPQVGDIGAQTLNAVATATVGGSTGNAPGIGITVVSGAFIAPLIFQWGQSNAPFGQDITFTDPETGSAFVPNSNITLRSGVTAKAQLTAYPYAVQHGIELSLGNDLATAQGSGPISMTKAALSGTSLQSWLSAGANFPTLTGAIEAAKASSPLRRVAFVCQQGETESQGSGSGTYQADLATFFALVRSLFGTEYVVRFYVVAVNPNCPTAPNLSVVRAAQSAACTADTNAVYVTDYDSIVPSVGGGLHYGTGQTFGMGSTMATRIVTDYAGGVATAGIGVSSDTIAGIFGSSLIRYYDSRLGASTTTLTDQTANVDNYTGTGMTVTATDSTLNNLQTVHIPSTTTLTSALVLPQAGTTPTTEIHVIKLASIGANQVLFSGGLNNDCFQEWQATNGCLESFNGTAVGNGAGNAEAAGQWLLHRSDFGNLATDVHASGRFSIQANAGNLAASAHVRTINGYSSKGTFDLLIKLTLNAPPTASQWNRLRNLLAKQVGTTWNNPVIQGL